MVFPKELNEKASSHDEVNSFSNLGRILLMLLFHHLKERAQIIIINNDHNMNMNNDSYGPGTILSSSSTRTYFILVTGR